MNKLSLKPKRPTRVLSFKQRLVLSANAAPKQATYPRGKLAMYQALYKHNLKTVIRFEDMYYHEEEACILDDVYVLSINNKDTLVDKSLEFIKQCQRTILDLSEPTITCR